jgi:MoxR-like ATPase
VTAPVPVSSSIASPPSSPGELLERVLFEVKRVVVGQDRMLERAMVCLLARGHCLIEGVPGLAKTLTVETLARSVRGSFVRIQFTPDLVPADIVGTLVYRPSQETRKRRSTSRSGRYSPTSCSPTRSTARRRRCSRRCSK